MNWFGFEVNWFSLEVNWMGSKARQLTADLREAPALLRNCVDKLLVCYQRPQPKFYTAYQSARLVINTAARHAKPAQPTA
jgi:hypothetical protein